MNTEEWPDIKFRRLVNENLFPALVKKIREADRKDQEKALSLGKPKKRKPESERVYKHLEGLKKKRIYKGKNTQELLHLTARDLGKTYDATQRAYYYYLEKLQKK
jgi:hypothetical protein